jgi:predicted lipoprotein
MKSWMIVLLSSLWLTSGCGSDSDSAATPPSPSGDNQADNGNEGSDSGTDGEPSFGSGDGFDRRQMLADIGQTTQQGVQRFVKRYDVFAEDFKAYCQTQKPGDRQIAQSSWQDMMREWHFIDAVPYGPLAEQKATLRVEIYSWPTVKLNLCRIDLNVIRSASQGIPLPSEFSQKGLDAVEYLLFDETYEHHCPSNTGPLADWNDKSLVEKQQARCNYAETLLSGLDQAVQTLNDRWSAGGSQNYQKFMTETAEPQTVIQDVYEGMIYFEKVLKDEKLAKPLGLSEDCANYPQACPDKREHAFAGFADAALQQNVKGFQAVYQGGTVEPTESETGTGFDDYLRARGHDELATFMSTALNKLVERVATAKDETQLMLAELTRTFSCQDAEEAFLCKAYQDIKAISGRLKTDFAEKLELEVPKEASGDTD